MFTLNDIVRVTKGRLVRGSGLSKIRKISIDSRQISRGSLFIAIEGTRYDGHRFIRQAFRNGAAGVVASRPISRLNRSQGLIIVDDTVRALGLLARAYRRRFRIPVVGITGSAGKTSTKEMIAEVLQTRFRVLRNPGTENNQFGVPLILFKIRPKHQVLVLELGSNRPGDIAWLGSLAEPDVSVFTNIGASHLERLERPSKVFDEKKALVSATRSDGAVIINADDRYLRRIKKRDISPSLLTYGMDNPADFRASRVRRPAAGAWSFTVNRRYRMSLAGSAHHQVYNALAALACARLFGIDVPAAARRLSQRCALPGRQDIRHYGGMVVIDDTYNANPVSFESALHTLAHLDGRGRKILVCADMLELGRQSRRLHARCGMQVARSNIDAVFGYGSQTIHLIRAARRTRPALHTAHFNDRRGLHRRLARFCRRGDICLVKGSRGMAMDRTVRFLKNNFCANKGK